MISKRNWEKYWDQGWSIKTKNGVLRPRTKQWDHGWNTETEDEIKNEFETIDADTILRLKMEYGDHGRNTETKHEILIPGYWDEECHIETEDEIMRLRIEYYSKDRMFHLGGILRIMEKYRSKGWNTKANRDRGWNIKIKEEDWGYVINIE
jgi:hypothetical protein